MNDLVIPGDVLRYARELYQPDDPLLLDLLQSMEREDLPQINIDAEEGKLLQMLVIASGGRRVLEIGTLGGYSAIWMGRGLAPDGRLISLEISPKHAEFARGFIQRAGLAGKVEVRVGAATEILPSLEWEGPFDLAFIDANKDDYLAYLHWCVHLVRPGGWITAHNTFAWGSVADPNTTEENVVAIQAFNRAVADHPDLLATIIPVADGLTVALKRP
ncbi:MAG TPA: O-methyltransferase [Ardenticatenaceae bacterium]|nr:O-methyltransferase [Ardenticatenaceae bacterium]